MPKRRCSTVSGSAARPACANCATRSIRAVGRPSTRQSTSCSNVWKAKATSSASAARAHWSSGPSWNAKKCSAAGLRPCLTRWVAAPSSRCSRAWCASSACRRTNCANCWPSLKTSSAKRNPSASADRGAAMQPLLETAISNALVASGLALVAFAVSRWRRPALAHALWLLVLLKLVTPPLIPVYLPALDTERRPGFAPGTTPGEETGRVPSNALSLGDIAGLLTWAEQDEAGTPSELASPDPAPQNAPESGSWQDWFVPLWLGGSTVWLACTLVSISRFQRLLRSARRA